LQAKAAGNEVCINSRRRIPRNILFAANEVPDAEGAPQEVEKYRETRRGDDRESKFGVECDSPEMQKLYQLAQAYHVPVLMHWQYKCITTASSAFTSAREISKGISSVTRRRGGARGKELRRSSGEQRLYPRGPITPGGWTENICGLSEHVRRSLGGVGIGALTRDPSFTPVFTRHQDKLVYGSDCNDPTKRSRPVRVAKPSRRCENSRPAKRSNESALRQCRRSFPAR